MVASLRRPGRRARGGPGGVRRSTPRTRPPRPSAPRALVGAFAGRASTSSTCCAPTAAAGSRCCRAGPGVPDRRRALRRQRAPASPRRRCSTAGSRTAPAPSWPPRSAAAPERVAASSRRRRTLAGPGAGPPGEAWVARAGGRRHVAAGTAPDDAEVARLLRGAARRRVPRRRLAPHDPRRGAATTSASGPTWSGAPRDLLGRAGGAARRSPRGSPGTARWRGAPSTGACEVDPDHALAELVAELLVHAVPPHVWERGAEPATPGVSRPPCRVRPGHGDPHGRRRGGAAPRRPRARGSDGRAAPRGAQAASASTARRRPGDCRGRPRTSSTRSCSGTSSRPAPTRPRPRDDALAQLVAARRTAAGAARAADAAVVAAGTLPLAATARPW